MRRTKKTKTPPRKKLSAEERARRREQRQRELASLYPRPLLYPRAHVARLLNCSVATITRLEKKGVLTPIRLDKDAPTAPVFYSDENLRALIGSDHAV